MGIFDALRGGREAARDELTPQEACIGLILGVARADGEASSEEIDSLIHLEKMRLYEGLSDEQKQRMRDRMIAMLHKRGAQALLDLSIRFCPPELRETMFARALDVVLADGIVEQEEKAAIQKLHRVLAVPDDVAHRIITVMKLWNH